MSNNHEMSVRNYRICSGSLLLLAVTLILSACSRSILNESSLYHSTSVASFPIPGIEFAPKSYICHKTNTPLVIDGILDEAAWENAMWTDYFVDIEGDLEPPPSLQTRVKMLWDEDCFYFAAFLEEPHISGTLTQRDAIIFHDNDFEIFIDPDGDTHEYYELELNALNTPWDLFLVKPYRDDGSALHSWDIQGLQTAVSIEGSINQPNDLDSGWTVEIAIPWKVLRECAHKPSPPEAGDQWRVNFSRVEWTMDIRDGQYIKAKNPVTGKNLPEANWVWSPQGLVAMHYPEMWGFVQFSDNTDVSNEDKFKLSLEEKAKRQLRLLYYAQKNYFERHDKYADNLGLLNVNFNTVNGYLFPPVLETTSSRFDASILSENGSAKLTISEDGRTRLLPIK